MSTVTVGCKFPNGLVLELGKMGETEGKNAYRRVYLNGSNTRRIHSVAAGHGLTDVDKDFWEAWSTKFKHLTALKEKHVFAVDDAASAQAVAIEHMGEKSGLEPLDPAALPAADESKHAELSVDAEHLQRVKRSGNRFAGIGGAG